jgi:hypothetical protein
MTKNILAIMLLGLLSACQMPAVVFFPDETSTVEAEQKLSAPDVPQDASKRTKCQGLTAAQQRAKRLLVTITTQFASGAPEEFGAGILLSMNDSQIFILTARHVVHKQNAGRPSIKVTLEGGDGTTHKFTARIDPRFAPSSGTYRDLAVLQADIKRDKHFPPPHWAVLRGARSNDNLKDFVVIGNPRGRGKKVTPKGDADYKSSSELRVNSGVMEPGYSGGGVFDAERRLVGIVFEDGGQYAAAYPINPVLDMLKTAGIRTDFTVAPASKRNIYLTDIQATTPELKQAALTAFTEALEKAGYEPNCSSPGAYKLSLLLNGIKTSGASSAVEIRPTFLGPDGGAFQIDKEDMSFLHVPGMSPLFSVEKLKSKMDEAAKRLLSKLQDKAM